MRTMLFLGVRVLLLALLFPVAQASADPVVAGQLNVFSAAITGIGEVRQGDVTISVATSGFVQAGMCLPCEVGAETSFTGLFVGSSGSIELFSPTFLLPDLPPSIPYTVSMPFTFSAARTGEWPEPPVGFSGSGTVTGQFFTQPFEDSRGLRTLFNFRSAQYVFGEETAAATPEPASMILIGTGIAGVWAQRRRQRRRTQAAP